MSNIFWTNREYADEPQLLLPGVNTDRVDPTWRRNFLREFYSLTPYLHRISHRQHEGFTHASFNAPNPNLFMGDSITNRYREDIEATRHSDLRPRFERAIDTYNEIVYQLNAYNFRRATRNEPEQQRQNIRVARVQPEPIMPEHKENIAPVMEQDTPPRYL